ncbi:MAG: hypothetical protein Q8L05_05285, partial [Actinomycetota bacterium]|nr:hypothetical protein [Actinomycetota bacterium]
ALVCTAGLVLASAGLVACSSSSPTTSAPATSKAPMSQAPMSQTPESQTPLVDEGFTYCDPLAAAYAIKPASGEPASNEELAAFGEAMFPVADAASADGREDLAEMFTLVAQVNSDPSSTTDAQTTEALNAVLTHADEVNATCGIDLLQ